jgi:hypothetical protein
MSLTSFAYQQSELSRREAERRNRLGERHAEVVSLRVQLAGINKAITVEADHLLSNIQNAYDIAAGRQQSIETSLQKLATARGNSEEYVKLRQLRRVADADRKLYESYLSQYNEISTRRTLQDASARIITRDPPRWARPPRRVLFYASLEPSGLPPHSRLLSCWNFARGCQTGAQVEQRRMSGRRHHPLSAIRKISPLARKQAGSLQSTRRFRTSEAVHAIRIGLQLSVMSEGQRLF